MNGYPDWLPPLIKLLDYAGIWDKYVEAIYHQFQKDFLGDRPDFQGRRLALKRHPLEQGKEATFWHFISSGQGEDERLPDLRRCERIGWPRAIIDNAEKEERVICWHNYSRGEKRIVLSLLDFSYIVVLADRRDYILPWTAYCVDREHTRKRLEKEYNGSQKG